MSLTIRTGIIRFLRRMKHEIPVIIVVRSPPKGVAMKVQRGRDELLEGDSNGNGDLMFQFEISVDNSGTTPNFLGKYAQGQRTRGSS